MKTALRVSGVIFSVVTLLHLARLIFRLKVVVGYYAVPSAASALAALAGLFLAAWMFKSARQG